MSTKVYKLVINSDTYLFSTREVMVASLMITYSNLGKIIIKEIVNEELVEVWLDSNQPTVQTPSFLGEAKLIQLAMPEIITQADHL